MLAQKKLSKKKVLYLAVIMAISIGTTAYLLVSNMNRGLVEPASDGSQGLISLLPTVSRSVQGGNIRFIDPANLLENDKFKELVDNWVTLPPEPVGKRDPFAPTDTDTSQKSIEQKSTFSLEVINPATTTDGSVVDSR